MSGLGAERERLAGEIASQRAELAEQREALVSELAAERNRLASEREALVSEVAAERQRLVSDLDERRAAWEHQREEQAEEWARQQGADMEALQKLRTETQGTVGWCGDVGGRTVELAGSHWQAGADGGVGSAAGCGYGGTAEAEDRDTGR